MDDCVFCKIAEKKAPAHIVYEDADHVAFLDKFPHTLGHLQLIPKKHYRWVWDIPHIGSFFTVAQTIIRAIIPVLGADHVTIATRGDEVQHAHLWIVPQYGRDKSVIEGKKWKSESKEEVATLLRERLKNI